MGLLKLLVHDPFAFVLIAVPLLYSVILHEVAHGWVAYKMGDKTAKWLGRLSLNPLKHLDPFGTLMLFLVGFGWAKPVPININNIPDRRKGLIFVSSAGIAANILLATLALLFFRLFSSSASETVAILVGLSGPDQHHARRPEPDSNSSARRLKNTDGNRAKEHRLFPLTP